MKQLSGAAVERAMKLQDVMLWAMAERISWSQAPIVHDLDHTFSITFWTARGGPLPEDRGCGNDPQPLLLDRYLTG